MSADVNAPVVLLGRDVDALRRYLARIDAGGDDARAAAFELAGAVEFLLDRRGATLLPMDRDGAVEAAAAAVEAVGDVEYREEEMAGAAVDAALRYLAGQSYPVVLGPAPGRQA